MPQLTDAERTELRKWGDESYDKFGLINPLISKDKYHQRLEEAYNVNGGSVESASKALAGTEERLAEYREEGHWGPSTIMRQSIAAAVLFFCLKKHGGLPAGN